MFDMFIEGTDEKKDGRQYITLTDFPLPVIVPGGIYAKRVKLVIDVTDRGLAPDADQFEFEAWTQREMARNSELGDSLMQFAREVSTLPFVQAEANAFLKKVAQ